MKDHENNKVLKTSPSGSLLGAVNSSYCQRAAEAKRPRLRGGSIIEPRVYLDVKGEKISSDPEKR